jgi:ADP-heptose:LPS heptosyltransferase
VFPNRIISKIAYKAGIPYRLGTNHVLHHWFYCNHLVNLGRRNSDLHESQLNLKLISGITGIGNFQLYDISKNYGLKAKEQLPDNISRLLDANKFKVILHPRSKGSAREWGLDNYSKLIELLPESQFQIFISGTRDESVPMRDFIEKYSTRVVNITGLLSLPEFIKFISITDALVAASTGPLHIASALGRLAIGLYAPMRPIHPGRWMPVGQNAFYFVVGKKCNKCRKSGICECIQLIKPENVAGLLQREAQKLKYAGINDN